MSRFLASVAIIVGAVAVNAVNRAFVPDEWVVAVALGIGLIFGQWLEAARRKGVAA